jgi:hypothetical protein
MIRFFRSLRGRLLVEEKFSKYFLYAVGEIVLVVIGILIALQINDANDARKERLKEVHYLENIKTDLNINIQEMDRYLAIRTGCIEAAQRIMAHFEGEPITDYDAFNADGVSIYSWQKFYQTNNTFQELVNSGNLALISNEAIKTGLMDLESLYKKMKSEEDHFRFDTEKLIYEPLYELMDLQKLVSNFAYVASGGSAGNKVTLDATYFADYLESLKLKNGFAMTILEFGTMNEQMRMMKQMSEELIASIDQEISG